MAVGRLAAVVLWRVAGQTFRVLCEGASLLSFELRIRFELKASLEAETLAQKSICVDDGRPDLHEPAEPSGRMQHYSNAARGSIGLELWMTCG